MRIFITGGTGFVGSHLTRKLVENHKVTVGSLSPEEATLELPEEVERERIDVTDKEVLDFSDYECVVHLVALSPLEKPPIPYSKIHFEGTENVVDQAQEDEVKRFFHMSSLGADENADTEYLRTKGEAEKYVENSNLDWRIMKPSTMFGNGGQFLKFLSGLTTPYLTVLPGKSTRFQPIYVEEVATLIENSLEDEYSGEKFEVGGPEKLSLGEIAVKIAKSEGGSLKALSLPMPIFKLAMTISERIPFSPFGIDQYYSLKTDNVTEQNSAEELGLRIDKMKTLDKYLEIEEDK
ncbi:MAG: complex I NDUFA9 subunit family protein [Nanohaloarchaea archaeon SW_4_43_9]|nr:MAG: complex I NDUFA9 subunit family protein [Nanohaloarchaea archaeon SW_4_43_9]